jgi:hypothetical protein
MSQKDYGFRIEENDKKQRVGRFPLINVNFFLPYPLCNPISFPLLIFRFSP